jgi:small conductance mechanosensitive channel
MRERPQGGPPILEPTLLVSIDWDEFAEYVLRVTGRTLLILIVAFIGLALLERLINPVIRIAIREQMQDEPEIEVAKRIETLTSVVYRTALVAVLIVVVVMILPQFGLNAAPLIAGLGLVGLAVGFGAQNLVKDVINGLFILIENQYGKGDVDTIAGISGLVEDINLRRTVLRDLDGTVHFVPHSQIAVASNFTKGFSRINLNVRIAYEADIDHATEGINRLGEELAKEPEYAGKIKDPPHVLRVDAMTDSAIELKIVGETAPIEQWTVMGELRQRLKETFEREGIVIPHLTLSTTPVVTASPGNDGAE